MAISDELHHDLPNECPVVSMLRKAPLRLRYDVMPYLYLGSGDCICKLTILYSGGTINSLLSGSPRLRQAWTKGAAKRRLQAAQWHPRIRREGFTPASQSHPSSPRTKAQSPLGSASTTHVALWQWDSRRSTPPNFALLSTGPWSACPLRKGLSRITSERLSIAFGDLSSGYSG